MTFNARVYSPTPYGDRKKLLKYIVKPKNKQASNLLKDSV